MGKRESELCTHAWRVVSYRSQPFGDEALKMSLGGRKP
jgi:hypothetical protein